MKNKIDQFFKDKLESHTLPPSEEAWSKVEANLSKKNNVVVWRIAAAILIAGALITVIFWSQHVADHQPSIVANHLPKDNSMKEKGAPKNSSKKKKEVLKSLPEKSSGKAALQSEIPVKVQHKKSVAAPDPTLTEKKLTSTEESVAAVEKPSEALAKEDKVEENNKHEATPPMAIASTHQKSIKLEFTLEEFSSEPPVATAGEAKSSGLKKVWEMAREVKNGDRPVRDMKNELFALNFRKNKNR